MRSNPGVFFLSSLQQSQLSELARFGLIVSNRGGGEGRTSLFVHEVLPRCGVVARNTVALLSVGAAGSIYLLPLA